MGAEAQVILSVKNLKKRIGSKEIIKGVTFDIREGEIFGFLGPNGSGKTTTIRMLVDLIRPTEGTVTLCGKDVQKDHDEALQYVGSIVENPEMYAYMTGWENLEQFARMTPGVGADRIHEVVEIAGLEKRIHDKVKTYSLGMRQRLGIAQALLGRPKLLILDEPTNGLDPQGIKELREFIRTLADQGISLFISSHLLSEIQLMCDKVAIITHGEVISVGTVDELVSQYAGTIVWNAEPAAEARSLLQQSDGVQLVDWDDEVHQRKSGQAQVASVEPANNGKIAVSMDEKDVPDLIERMVQSGIRVFSVEHKNPTLEELFLRLTEGERID